MSSIVRGGGLLVPVGRNGNPKPMSWTTAEGDEILITDMETSHLFNAMKMVFNHLASMWGGEPVRFNHKYSDYTTKSISARDMLARQVVQMTMELERRSDLPRWPDPLYENIKKQIGFDKVPKLQSENEVNDNE